MTIKVTGTNFPTQAAIIWNGASLPTTVIDSNNLSGSVGSSNLAAPGTVQLMVRNTQTMQNSQSVPITITSANSGPSTPLTITTTTLAQGGVSVPYAVTLNASGGTSPYSWSITSGQLPPGLNLAANTGILSGTPTASGNYSVGVTVTDASSPAQSATSTLALSVGAAPATPTALIINTSSLSSGIIGSAYSTSLQASGGTAPYNWSLVSGNIPAGLSLNTSTGLITGIPSATGTANFTVTVADSESPAQTKSASLSIVIAPVPVAITTSALPSGTIGSSYSTVLQASGGTSPYTWSISGGNLPAGLSLSSSTGIISGTPTATGTASFTATVADAENPAQTKSVVMSLIIAPVALTIATSALPSGTQGASYSQALQASGGTAPYTWSISSGSLPAGLSLASSSGLISGTPTVSGNNLSFGVTVKDAGSPAQSTTATITLSLVATGAPLAIGSTSLPGGVPNQAYSATLDATGGTAPYTWSITGTLPSGLSFAKSTGIISGTPTANSTTSLTFKVVDSSNPVQSQSIKLSLVIASVPLTVATSSLPSGTLGASYANLVQASGGTTPYSWSITAGSLPAGLSLGTTTGLISGSPTAIGTSKFTATVTDSGSPAQTKSATLSIVITAPPLAISASLPAATAGTAYSNAMTASGGTPAYTWSITAGSLPAGLTLAATSGVISGTPTTSGTYNFTATVSDSSTPALTQSAATSIVVAAAQAPSGPGTTWYVRPDGGTRYSSNSTTGQCDGLGDSAYSGSGVNQHCAFNDVRYLWEDGSYTYGTTFPGWGWIIAGGDTVIIRGSIATGVSYRVGWNSASTYCDSTGCWGITGSPSASGPPSPPSGTATQHTRILGENYAACTSQSARTQLHGGWGVGAVLSLNGSSYVDVACLDITDFSNCGKDTDTVACESNGMVTSDFANVGVTINNTATNITLTDIRIHGVASDGILGAPGNGFFATDLAIMGNADAGWNADDGSGTTGVGSLLVQNFNISWNGCVEEYPIVDPLPYFSCTDQSSGGYGDGFGTATVASAAPGWQVHFDNGIVSYNTQDGLDALHISGPGSTMTDTRVLAFGNEGQQLKVGGATATIQDSVIVGNCEAMSTQAIPGTPTGFGSLLAAACRAGNTAVLINVTPGDPATFQNNTIYESGAIGLEVEYASGTPDPTDTLKFNNNIFVGFVNAGNNSYPTPIYSNSDLNMLTNQGASWTNNATFGARSNWSCPAAGESNAVCTDPGLVDETYHAYGYGNMAPASSTSAVVGAGVAIPSITVDYTGVTRPNPPSIGAYELPPVP